MTQYWDKNGKIHSDNEQKASIQKRAYNFLLSQFGDIKNEDVAMEIVGALAPMSKAKYIPEMISAARLLYHKPFEKMTPEEYNKYGRLGMDYYKKYIKGEKAYNKEVQNADYKNREGIMFTGKRAGEPDYRFMEQYPNLIKNIENSMENYFTDVKPKIKDDGTKYIRKDSKGFSNLKVNWKDKDYTYQIRHNPSLEMPDFYNIKPYDLLIEQIKKGSP